MGRLTQTTYVDGTYTRMSYDPSGLPITRTDELGRMTQLGYDGAGRLTSVT